MNLKIAPDIIQKINSDFAKEHVEEVTEILVKAVSGVSIVGRDQLARSILFLCKGDIAVLKNESLPMLMRLDPRDIIMTAEVQAGHPEHYFGLTFEEIEIYGRGLHANWDSLCQEEELKKEIDWEYFHTDSPPTSKQK
jgi:hypothetical protein